MVLIIRVVFVKLHAIKDSIKKHQIMNVKNVMIDVLNVLEVVKTFAVNVRSDTICMIQFVYKCVPQINK